jgi:hypothetical protein
MRFILTTVLVCVMSSFALAQGPHGRGPGGPPELKQGQLPAPSWFGGRAWAIPGGENVKVMPVPHFMGGPGHQELGPPQHRGPDKQIVKSKTIPRVDKQITKHKKHKQHKKHNKDNKMNYCPNCGRCLNNSK